MVDTKENALDSNSTEGRVSASVRPSSSSRNVTILGIFVVAVIFLGFGLWAATAPLARAVAAFGTLAVKSERKQIQHFEGGIVRSMPVSEGQLVKKGDLLVALDPLHASATVARDNGQLDQALARELRLESELKGLATIELEGRLLERLSVDKSVYAIVEAEQRHLTARQETIDGTIEILTQRMNQLNDEIKGLQIQRESRIEQLEIFKEQIIGLRELNAKGYYPKSSLLSVERAIVQLRGAAGNDLALIARSKSSKGEAKSQIVSLKQRHREDIVKQLRDIKLQIADLKERLLVAEDVLQRIEVKAPRTGIIQGINFHTVGGVVKPGDVLMEIAPQDDEIVVNAHVSPTDIDSLVVGQRAELRLTALNVRTTPAIYGYVISVSGDSLVDSRANMPYFLTRIEIPKEERQKLGGVRLTAGMPADVLIQTGERTALNYLVKPVLDAFARGLNEE